MDHQKELPYVWTLFAGETGAPPRRLDALTTCPFCTQTLLIVANDPEGDEQLPGSIKSCICGWWACSQFVDYCNDGNERLFLGILKAFTETDADVPVEVLREELRHSPDFAHQVDPHRFQELVADILRGAWNCDVRNLGRTRDGGVDLLALRSDDAVVAVQVKRRQSADSSEPVSVVREFLGAALLRGHTELALVTTAARFTKGSREDAGLAVDTSLVTRFDLIDRPGLYAILDLIPPIAPWRAALARGTPPPRYRDARMVGLKEALPQLAPLIRP